MRFIRLSKSIFEASNIGPSTQANFVSPITSIKSLDLNAKSYQSGNAVFNRVKGYIDKLVDFKGGRLGDKDIKNVDFDNRVLELAIPERATDSQLEQLRRLQEYAQEQNIQLTIVLAK